MQFLRTIDPLKSLKGKLNFLKQQSQPILDIVKVANSLGSANSKQGQQKLSSLTKTTLQEIKALASQNKLTEKTYRKTLFEIHANKNANLNLPIGTVLQELDVHQKRVVLSVLKLTDKLSARQIAYLQYAMRQRMNGICPSWKNLHFNPDSPLRKQFTVLPSLTSLQRLGELKIAERKKVTSAIIASRKKEEKPVPKA